MADKIEREDGENTACLGVVFERSQKRITGEKDVCCFLFSQSARNHAPCGR